MKNEVGDSYFLLNGVPFLGIIPKFNKSATTFLDNNNAVPLILSLDLVIKQLSDALLEKVNSSFFFEKSETGRALEVPLLFNHLDPQGY